MNAPSDPRADGPAPRDYDAYDEPARPGRHEPQDQNAKRNNSEDGAGAGNDDNGDKNDKETKTGGKDDRKPKKMKRSTLIKVILGIALLLLAVGIYIVLHLGQESTDDAVIESHVVVLAAKVPGYVKTLYINDNSHVHAGDVLAEIDPRDYTIRRDRAAALFAAAEAQAFASGRNLATTRVSAPSNIDAARAQVMSAEANLKKASDDLKRLRRLSDEARSRQQLDAAVAAQKTAFANVEDAKSRLRTAETAPKTIEAAKANAQALIAQAGQARADLAQAEKDLADTRILAPMDGVITNKAVEIGDYLQTGQQLGSLVSDDVWVVANYKETQLKNMRVGQRVAIEIDAFKGQTFEGRIDSFQAGTGARFSTFPPENATGNFIKIVQRVPVKIVFAHRPDQAIPIGPGMSVVPTVYTQ